jgi:hypothetical protein
LGVIIVPYTAEISRANPGCLLFVIDQSGSMADRLEEGTKADVVATTLNRVLQDLIIRCSKEDVYDYFDVGVIGYGHAGPTNALRGPLADSILNPISQVAAHPARVEDRVRKMADGAGGLIEAPVRFPVWFEPVANGGTPMVAALSLAGQCLADWCDSHEHNFPPVLMHLTDGESTDGSPEEVADTIRQISTEDGELLLMNIHVSGVSSREITFPDAENELVDDYARMLFRMSSPMPESMREIARTHGFDLNEQSRAFMFNAKTEQIIQFFNIGTRPSNLR